MARGACRHQDGESYCQKLKVGCRPGMVGCVLRGKEHFDHDEEGFPVLFFNGELKKNRALRKPKGSF